MLCLPTACQNGMSAFSRFKHVPPILADVGVHVGVGLHEHQVRARGRGGQFVGHPSAAVFLLRGGHQQHVALRQDRPQASEVVAGRGEGRGGDEEKGRGEASGGRSPCLTSFVPRPSPLSSLPSSVVSGSGQSTNTRSRSAGRSRSIHSTDRAIDAEQFRRQTGMADERGAGCRGAGTAGLHHFRPEQGIHQRALARAGAAQRGHDQRRFESHAERVGPGGKAADQRPAFLGRLPCRAPRRTNG